MAKYDVKQNYAGLRVGDVINLPDDAIDERLERGIKGGIIVPIEVKKKKAPEKAEEVNENKPVDTADK